MAESRYRNGVLFDEIIEIVDPEPHGAAWNMAADEALLNEATQPTARVYRWARPSVSFGYFGRFAEVSERWPKHDLVRRWTGGGIVLHEADVTYSLVIPRAHPFAALSPADSYGVIHGALMRWLREAGIGASLAEQAQTQGSECFTAPVAQDILAGGEKIGGAAQRRARAGVLHQGSIQGAVLAGRSLRAGLASAFAGSAAQRPFSARERELAERLVAEKYGTDAWLKRW